MPKNKQAPNKQLETLEAMFRLADTANSAAEMVQAFKAVLALATEMKKSHDELKTNFYGATEKTLLDIHSRAQTRLNQLRDGRTPIKNVDYFDGEPGKPGKDADEDKITEKVLSKIKFPKQKEMILDGPLEIKTKLESLEGDDRLHFSRIGGLEDWEEVKRKSNVTFINGKGPLWGLEDVNVVGITIGQSIQWNGIQWVPYTPGGGSSGPTAPLGTVNGSNLTFTSTTQPTIVFTEGGSFTNGFGVTITGSGSSYTIVFAAGLAPQQWVYYI
jgi:hypothetical protein